MPALSPPVDGRGRTPALTDAPQRLVSLVPSTTETLFALGLGPRVVGVTRFCVRPASARDLAKVGGTKDADPERILALDPDLVVGNCEENTRELFDALEGRVPVWAAFPRTVDDALDDLSAVGRLCGAHEASRTHRQAIEAARADLHAAADAAGPFTYVALIWNRPLMSVSDDTFVSAMLAEAGGRNAVGDRPDRFPVLEPGALAAASPDVVLLLSEPFPFRPRHAARLVADTGLPEDRFRYVDGQHLTWHGVRMAPAFRELARARRHGFARAPGD
jgi:ABC-type Fe3+-hydroxamate transport system substrate-binding protein